MKLGSGVVLLLLVLAGGLMAQPKIEIPFNKFEFGMAPQNSTLVHYFWFKNPGTDTLRVTDIVTGCDCTTMPLSQKWIAPGDSLHVALFWQTELKNGNAGRYPYIYTNAGQDPARITLTALVLPSLDSIRPVSIKPYKMELSKLPTMSVDSIGFVLTNQLATNVALKIITPPVEECDVYIPDSIPAGSQSRGYVKIKPEYRDLQFERSFTMMVTAAKEPTVRITIPIHRKVFGEPGQ
jgi:hypothetical protein